MFEGINCFRRSPALEDQLRGDETGKSGLQLILRKTRDGMQQRVGKLASYGRAYLRD
jgi:hypothetical protein